jgi:hypothetical protein
MRKSVLLFLPRSVLSLSLNFSKIKLSTFFIFQEIWKHLKNIKNVFFLRWYDYITFCRSTSHTNICFVLFNLKSSKNLFSNYVWQNIVFVMQLLKSTKATTQKWCNHTHIDRELRSWQNNSYIWYFFIISLFSHSLFPNRMTKFMWAIIFRPNFLECKKQNWNDKKVSNIVLFLVSHNCENKYEQEYWCESFFRLWLHIVSPKFRKVTKIK